MRLLDELKLWFCEGLWCGLQTHRVQIRRARDWIKMNLRPGPAQVRLLLEARNGARGRNLYSRRPLRPRAGCRRLSD